MQDKQQGKQQGKCKNCGHFQEVDPNEGITMCENCKKIKDSDTWINFAKEDNG